MKRYQIGRSADKADIVVEDPERTISAIHGEMSCDELGRWFYQDASRNGTYVHRGEEWVRLEKGFISPDERLRLGAQEVAVTWLIQQATRLAKSDPPKAARGPDRGGGDLPPAPASATGQIFPKAPKKSSGGLGASPNDSPKPTPKASTKAA